MLRNVYTILAEIHCRNSFYIDKSPEIDFQVVFFCQVEVRGLFRFWPWLRNENSFYFQLSVFEAKADPYLLLLLHQYYFAD